MIRSYGEYSRRMSQIMHTPCPDCGALLPCVTDADHIARKAHYQSCPGKPPAAPVPVFADVSGLSRESLIELRRRIEDRFVLARTAPAWKRRIVHRALQPQLDTIEAALLTCRTKGLKS